MTRKGGRGRPLAGKSVVFIKTKKKKVKRNEYVREREGLEKKIYQGREMGGGPSRECIAPVVATCTLLCIISSWSLTR